MIPEEICEKCNFEWYCCICTDIPHIVLLERRIKSLERSLKTIGRSNAIQIINLQKKIFDLQMSIIINK
jgi:hypothetical protein